MNKQILELFQANDVLSLEDLKQNLHFSERKVRGLLSQIRQDEKSNGFKIVTVSKRGYFLQINNQEMFDTYMSNQKGDLQEYIGKKEYRISLILFLLLQNTGFISINQIAQVLDVSRRTIINDLSEVKKQLHTYEIELESRSHYGVRVIGKEKDIRQMLSRISGDIAKTQEIPIEFFNFIEQLDFSKETEKFVSLLNQYNILMTNNAIESILFHLKILVYRILQNNYINEIRINRNMIDSTIYSITNEIISFIEENHNIHVTSDEIDLVASQIFGKASSEKIPEKQKNEMSASIESVLAKLDSDFETNFTNDELLKESLLLHLHPLLMRVTYGLTLSDSLIGSISVQHMNAFLVAIQFIDYHDELKGCKLSRDEIGYLALHFATHIERENQRKLQRIKKIAFVADNMRSSTLFIKTKIQSCFPLANVIVIAQSNVDKHDLSDIELIITTEPILVDKQQNKVVMISEQFDEMEFSKIKNEVIFTVDNYTNETLGIKDLFYEDLFIVKKRGDYIALIEEMCSKMVQLGYAQDGYKQSVLERESRFSTIYGNGIAAPHSLKQMGNVDSIGVILLEEPTVYDGKEVRYIFVINVKKGHLLLHQEISDFLVRLMNDENKVKLLELVNTFQNFNVFIKDYL